MAIMKRHYFSFYTNDFGECLDLSKRAKEAGGKVQNDELFLCKAGEKTYNNKYCVNCWIPDTVWAYAHLHNVSIQEATEKTRDFRKSHRKWLRDWATGKLPKNGPYEY